MVYNQTNFKGLRDIVNDALDKVTSFNHLVEVIEELYYDNTKYDAYTDSDGENYIINRNTGEYINWYKLYHFGRDIHINVQTPFSDREGMSPWIESFLKEFINSLDKTQEQQ